MGPFASAPKLSEENREKLEAGKPILFQGGIKIVKNKQTGQTGHGLSLASILELSVAIWAIREGIIPGTFGLKELDLLAGKVRMIPTATKADLRVAMSNSSGFGGSNVSLIVSKP